MIDSRPDSELVLLAVDGNRDAFSQLCERHKKRLWRITSGVVRGTDAEDLAQEAIVRAWCAIDTCRNAASFEAWLSRIAVNAAHDYHRSAWRRRIVFGGGADIETAIDSDMALEALRRDTARRIRKAVAALPQRQCVPIWMYYFEQFTISEIAALESVAESTIRSRIQVGMRRLRTALGDVISEREPGAESQMAVVKGTQL